MQVGEGASKQGRRSGRSPAQDQTLPDLEIGVFFDGTLNSIRNAEQRDDDGTSYSNARSNIALLYRLYRRNETADENGVVRRSLYVTGIAVRPGEEDNELAAGLGTGRDGVADRVHWACARLRAIVGSNRYANVTIDVFGFSRGAAAARYFINSVNQGSFGRLDGGTARSVQSGDIVDDRAITLGPVTLPEATIRFAGLFDTVAAIGSAHDPVNINLRDGSANAVVHLTAADEYRQGFSLDSLRDEHGGIPSGWVEESLPGAHSDIGGGYRGIGETLVPIAPLVRSLGSGVSMGSAIAEYRQEVDSFKQRVRDGGFATNREENFRLVTDQDRTPGDPVQYAHCIWMRHVVRNGMDKVSLQVMHDQASMESVPFAPVPNRAPYSIPENLGPVLERLRRAEAITDQQRSLIHLYYTHWSAHYGRVQGRRTDVFRGRDTDRHFMAPAENWVRRVNWNDPSQAVAPR